MPRALHTPEAITAAMIELNSQSDRGAAIIAAAMLEEILENAIVRRFRPLSNTRYKDLFVGTAPLSTFAAKIDIAFAIGLVTENGFQLLNLIKDVRNKFAHRIEPLTFEHPTIKQLIKSNNSVSSTSWPENSTIRERFIWSFRLIGVMLIMWTDQRAQLKMVGNDSPELFAAIQDYFSEAHLAATLEELAPEPPPDAVASQPTKPETPDQPA